MSIITLTTDFGDADGYVGAIKGVILSLTPHVTVVDISHAVPAQQVRHAARVLKTAVPFFPPGTIHVAVVDPGVGSQRRGIALQTPTAILVGPDNGLFSPFLHECLTCVALTNPAAHRHPVSATFHGRDIFAPVAAHLANGMPLAALGPVVDDPVTWLEPRPERLSDGRLRAQVVYVDHFGNLVTNTRPLTDWGDVQVSIGDTTLSLRRTYADVAPGELVALVGSSGYLEVALRDGSAVERLGIVVGSPVEIQGAEDAMDDLDSGTLFADH